MADILPGTALESMINEYTLLDNIKDTLQARVALDKQYTSDLCKIRDSFVANPSFNSEKTKIGRLISSFVQFFDDEIKQRNRTCQELTDCLLGMTLSNPKGNNLSSKSSDENEDEDAPISPSSSLSSSSTLFSPTHCHPPLPFLLSPNPSAPLSSSSINLYRDAVDSYKAVREAHEDVRTPSSLSHLRKWKNRLERIDFLNWTIGPSHFQMPESERRYRECVKRQRKASKRASEFHTEILSNQIEQHQSSLELAQSCLLSFMNTLSEGLAGIIPVCSEISFSVSKFSPSRCIAPKYHAYEVEKESDILQPYPYRNYWNDMEETVPVFPLDAELTEELVKLGIHKTTWNIPSDFSEDALTLERHISVLSNSRSLNDRIVESMSRLTSVQRLHLLAFNLLISPQLFPINNDIAMKYRAGVSRSKIPKLLEPTLNPDVYARSDQVLRTVMSSGLSCFGKAVLLNHRTDTDKFILSLMRKWDFTNHQPLPPGFVNEWTHRHDWTRISREVARWLL